jgi:transcription elongation factor GreA
VGKIIRYNLNDRKKTLQQNQIVFTAEGLEKFKQERDELLAKRPVAVTTLQKAREMGDLSENGAYKAARFELNSLDSRLRHLERVIANAKVVENTHTGVVGVGSIVTVSDGKTSTTYTIVGGYETNLLEKKISINSPIGKALLGKKVGETADVTVPAGVISYTISEIH